MSLLVVGTLAFDSVNTPFGERTETLGGSASYLGIAASYFCDVAIVGVIGEDFPEEHLNFFKQRGIDIEGVEKLPGRTFRWRGSYHDDLNNRDTLETQLNVLVSFDPKLPKKYRDSPFVFLGNIAPELQSKVINQLNSPKMVAADTMNFWIEGSNELLQEAIKGVDLLSINDSEARQLSSEYNLVKAAAAIREMGPKILIVKRGEHGATVFTEDQIFIAPAYPIATICDPTGAGDSFAGGMMGFLSRCGKIDHQTLRQSVIMGSVLASYSVEDFSLDRFRTLTKAEISRRFKEFKDLTDFEVANISL